MPESLKSIRWQRTKTQMRALYQVSSVRISPENF
ncbi:hypothetical protein [Acetivibrio straminisolvens]